MRKQPQTQRTVNQTTENNLQTEDPLTKVGQNRTARSDDHSGEQNGVWQGGAGKGEKWRRQ